MRITTKGRYALRAITNLAMNGSDRPTPIKQIAADEDISESERERLRALLESDADTTSKAPTKP